MESLLRDIDRIDDLEKALRACVAAMKQSIEVGCTDHLDCCDDGGAFWHNAFEEAEELLKP